MTDGASASNGPAASLHVAHEHFRDGRLAQAEAECRRILQQRRDDPEALHLLGRVLRRLGQSGFAIALLEKALQHAPDASGIRVSLGEAQLDHGLPEAAIAQYRLVSSRQPDDLRAMLGLAIALQAAGRFDEAYAQLLACSALTPDDRATNFHLVNCLHTLGRPTDALNAYRHLLSKDSWYAAAHAKWAEILVRRQRRSEAKAVLTIGLALQPHDARLQFALAALGGLPQPQRAPDGFLISHFDDFAEHFDDVLLARLNYQIPQLLAGELRRALECDTAQLDILDLGCGTGLCGLEVSPLAHRLVGIDLSQRMLEQARQRKIYETLQWGELVAAVSALHETFDLVIAGDVLIYFGDLHDLLAGAARVLRPGGLLAVSTELLDGVGYALHAGGRYAHSRDYLIETAVAQDLAPMSVRECNGRLEAGKPVRHLIGVFRRADGA